MTLSAHSLPRYAIDEAFTPPTPDNNNWHLKPEWQTPAETLQQICRLKRELLQELMGDSRLWNCPKHRRMRELTAGAEKCALQQFRRKT